MTQYRYIFTDLLTNQRLAELPLYGVYCDRVLSKPGNWTGTVFLGANDNKWRQMVIASTLPGKTAIWVDRDGTLVWGGIIWSRTYQAQSMSLQMTAQTFDSYLFKRVNTVKRTWTDVDKRNVARELVDAMQAEAFSNIGITVPSAFATEFPTTRTIESWDYAVYGEYIQQMAAEEGGFDWTVDVTYIQNTPSKILSLGAPVLGAQAPLSGLVFPYPVSIKNYYWSESASKSANNAFAIGSGEGAAMIVATATDGGVSNTDGFPRLDAISSHKDVTQQATIQEHANTTIQSSPLPVVQPTIQTRPELPPEFGSYSLGTAARFLLEDQFRFATEPNNTKDVWLRIIGWTLRPPSSDGTEEASLVLQGEGEFAT